MVYVIENGEQYVLKFNYDPCLIGHVKNVPGRRWDNNEKIWTIPKNHLGWFLNEVKGTVYEDDVQVYSSEQIDQNATLDSTNKTEIPDIDISDMDLYVQNGSKLYEHQLDFLRYAKSRAGHGFILADEMGCGKTLEVTNYSLYMRKKYNYRHCLIICCVNSAKYSWQEDIAKHTNNAEQAYILGARKKKTGIVYNTSGADKLKDLTIGYMYGDVSEPELPYFLLTNIESLRTKSGKQYTVANEIINMIRQNKLQMIVIDEVHKNMSPTSIQGKLVLQIKKQTGTMAEWIPMTGTPIVNKPTDVFTPLKLVDGHSFKSFWQWKQYFCLFGGYEDHNIIAYKNIPKLKQLLQGNMIRRLKKDVLDLPDKIYYTEYVENTSFQQKLYHNVEQDIIAHRDEILHSMNPLTKMLRLRQVNGSPELVDNTIEIDKNYLKKNAKLVRLLELIDEIVERGEKVVIFSNWVETLKSVYRFVGAKYKTTCFTGTMSEQDRQKHKRVFLNNPEYSVMLGTVGALGVNHTLTVANNVIFYDEPWNNATKVQCEDRCHRIGSTEPVNIYTILAKGTIDETVNKILHEKQEISDYIVDGQLDLRKNPELFEKLLGTSDLTSQNS